MQIRCPKCDNEKSFIVPVWVRATFRFNDDDTISLLHTRFLEPVEEKLIGGQVKCAVCKSYAVLEMENEQQALEQQTLEAL
jgi:hypothetical protein